MKRSFPPVLKSPFMPVPAKKGTVMSALSIVTVSSVERRVLVMLDELGLMKKSTAPRVGMASGSIPFTTL